LPRGLAHEHQDDRDRADSEDGRSEKRRAHSVSLLAAKEIERPVGDERTHDRAERVHHPMESERAPECVRLGGLGDERVARSGADPFADPVDQPDAENVSAGHAEGEQGLGHRREDVSGGGDALSAANPVRIPARGHFQQAGGAFGDALDESQEGAVKPEHLRDEQREQGQDGFALHVAQKAHPSERSDVSAKLGGHCFYPDFSRRSP